MCDKWIRKYIWYSYLQYRGISQVWWRNSTGGGWACVLIKYWYINLAKATCGTPVYPSAICMISFISVIFVSDSIFLATVGELIQRLQGCRLPDNSKKDKWVTAKKNCICMGKPVFPVDHKFSFVSNKYDAITVLYCYSACMFIPYIILSGPDTKIWF